MTNDRQTPRGRKPEPRPEPDRDPGINSLSQDDIDRLRRLAERESERQRANEEWMARRRAISDHTITALITAAIVGGPVPWMRDVFHAVWAKIFGH